MSDPVTAQPTGAISRTYLHQGRKVAKAKTLGRPLGVIRLSRDEDVLEGLHLGEGIETALDGDGARPQGDMGLWRRRPFSRASRFCPGSNA